MVQTWWQKLNANERMAATGAIIVFVLALLGGSWLALVGAGVVIAIYWLKYSPNQVSWPAPIELINLVISGIIALFAVVGALFILGLGGLGFGMLGVFGGFFGGMYLLAVAASIAFVVGAAMMLLGTWREYQAMPKGASGSGAPSTSAPPPPPTAPPAAPPSTMSTPPGAPPDEPPGSPPSTSTGA